MKNKNWLHFVFGLMIALILVAMIVACGSLTIKDLDWKSLPRDVEPVFQGAGFGLDFLSGLGNGIMQLGTSWIDKAFNWNKEDSVRQMMFDRDDNAVQRRVADLRAVGLSPTLAAGSAAGNTATSISSSGSGIDALNGAMQAASVKNAQEENANLRKSRQVMNADIALKFGNMQKEFAEANYFNQQAATSAVDSQLKSAFILKAFQDIAESKERSKGYQYKALSDFGNYALHGWEAANAALDNALIQQTGLRSSVGGVAPSIMKLGARGLSQFMDSFSLGDQFFMGNNFMSAMMDNFLKGYNKGGR